MSETTDRAWEAWTPRLTDLSLPAPAYKEAFDAGWAAAELSQGLRESGNGEVHDLGSFAQ